MPQQVTEQHGPANGAGGVHGANGGARQPEVRRIGDRAHREEGQAVPTGNGRDGGAFHVEGDDVELRREITLVRRGRREPVGSEQRLRVDAARTLQRL